MASNSSTFRFFKKPSSSWSNIYFSYEIFMNCVHFVFIFIPRFFKNSYLISCKIGSKIRGISLGYSKLLFLFWASQVDRFLHFCKFTFHFCFILYSIEIKRTYLEIVFLSGYLELVFYLTTVKLLILSFSFKVISLSKVSVNFSSISPKNTIFKIKWD